MRYLTKSRFKLGCECPAKLFYTGKKNEYADASLDDPFLMALAKGGFQVGELAKFLYEKDDRTLPPTINRDHSEGNYHQQMIDKTIHHINNGEKVIFEAAISFENYFILVDVLEIDTEKKNIIINEVKAKSFAPSEDEFWKRSRKKEKDIIGIHKDWEPYLLDVTFQKWVTKQAFPGYNITANLILVNKEKACDKDGQYQKFILKQKGNQSYVEIKEGTTAADLDTGILIKINVDQEIKWIFEEQRLINLYDGTWRSYSFSEYTSFLCQNYVEDKKIRSQITKDCKGCQFFSDADSNLKNGLKECWKDNTPLTDDELDQTLIIKLSGLYGGGKSLVQEQIKDKKYLLKDANTSIFTVKSETDAFTAYDRRLKHIEKTKTNDFNPVFQSEGLKAELQRWKFPLNMIDFETATAAIPLYKGNKPYKTIAFQFSHHILHEDGRIEHKNQYLNFEQGVFPNYNFVRELKKALSSNKGSIFRYHNHENTVLNHIKTQLEDDKTVSDRDDLIDFISEITQIKENRKIIWEGSRGMIDLYDVVIKYFYSLHAGGSNSLKYILPAAIKSSKKLQEKYSAGGVYGKNCSISSLNFDDHTWLTANTNGNPYRSLPQVFEGYDNNLLDEVFGNGGETDEELADGGAALIAYCKLQYTHVPNDQREKMRDALLRYCELDTMAMVMLAEYFRDVTGIHKL